MDLDRCFPFRRLALGEVPGFHLVADVEGEIERHIQRIRRVHKDEFALGAVALEQRVIDPLFVVGVLDAFDRGFADVLGCEDDQPAVQGQFDGPRPRQGV